MKIQRVVIFLFIIAIISGFFWNHQMFGQSINNDQMVYDGTAVNVLAGKGFTWEGQESPVEPLYPLTLAGVYAVFGRQLDVVRVLQIILFAFTILISYRLAIGVVGPIVALRSHVLLALFWGIANQAGDVLTETLFIFLFILMVWVLTSGRSGKGKSLFVAGILLAMCALTKGIMQYFIVPAVFVMLLDFVYYKSYLWRKAIKATLIFVFGFVLGMSPWWAYSVLHSNSFSTTSQTGGILAVRASVMRSLSPDYVGHFIGHSLGYYFAQKIYPHLDPVAFREPPGMEARLAELLAAGNSFQEADVIMQHESLPNIIYHPVQYVGMSVLDFLTLNSPIVPIEPHLQNSQVIHPMFSSVSASRIAEWQKPAILASLHLLWYLLMILVCIGAWQIYRSNKHSIWIIAVVVYINVAYSAIHALPRYALPIYPFYGMLAVFAVSYLWNQKRNRSSSNSRGSTSLL